MVGCSGGGREDDTSGSTTAGTTTPTSTTGVPTTQDATSTTGTSETPTTGEPDPSTTEACTDGEENCPCLPLEACKGALQCLEGLCVAVSSTTSTTEGGSTTGGEESSTGAVMAACGDNDKAAGELCFAMAKPLGMGGGPVAVAVADFNNDGYVV